MISAVATIDEVRQYWDHHIHDLEITRHPVGSRGFFDDLDQYHFEKLHHLLRLAGVDLSAAAIGLARTNFEQQRLRGRFEVADGEALPFADDTFDLVFAHGV